MKTPFERLAIEIKKLNGDWKPDFKNHNQKKYFNYFEVKDGKFVFYGVSCNCGNVSVPAALHLKTRELALCAKDNLFELYKECYLYEVNEVKQVNYSYLVNEKDSDNSFAVITANSNDSIREKVSIAVQSVFMYDSVTSEIISDRSGTILIECSCIIDDEIVSTKEVELSLVNIF